MEANSYDNVVATDNTVVAAGLVLAGLEAPAEVKKIVRTMKSALSRTKKAVDMVGVANTKAVITAFSGVDTDTIDSILLTEGLMIRDHNGVRVIVSASENN